MSKRSEISGKTKATTPYKMMNEVVDGERYCTDLAYLIASDEDKNVFLFRSVSSLYFTQTHGKKGDTLTPLSLGDAEAMYETMPTKHQGLVASFPKKHGGVGMDTPTKYDNV